MTAAAKRKRNRGKASGKSRSRGKAPRAELDVGVEFGSFSSGGKRGCSLGISILKDGAPEISVIDRMLCNSRLNVSLLNGGKKDVAGQATSEALGASRFSSVADVNSFSSKKLSYSAKLQFKLSGDADDEEMIAALSHLAGKSGRLRADFVSAAGGDDELVNAEADDPDQQTIGGGDDEDAGEE